MNSNRVIFAAVAIAVAMPVLGQNAETAPGNAGAASSADAAATSSRVTRTIDFRSASEYQPLNGKERWQLYLDNTFLRPSAFFRAAGPALGDQIANEPPQWSQGMSGYSKRLADRFGRFALQESYQAAAAAVLHHEVRYVRSEKRDFVSRTAHALASSFLTYDRNGRRIPDIAGVGSTVAAEFTGNLWLPSGYRDTAETMSGVGMQIGATGVMNLYREFSPELKRMFRWK